MSYLLGKTIFNFIFKITMPAFCALTGKTRHKIIKRSKSMHGTITFLKPNLVSKRGEKLNAMLGQEYFSPNKKIKVSARALRTIKNKIMKIK
jgi:ribosomal protein L28